jgi:hypothetical protein
MQLKKVMVQIFVLTVAFVTMASGKSKMETLEAFLNNPEWTSICNIFNLTSYSSA